MEGEAAMELHAGNWLGLAPLGINLFLWKLQATAYLPTPVPAALWLIGHDLCCIGTQTGLASITLGQNGLWLPSLTK